MRLPATEITVLLACTVMASTLALPAVAETPQLEVVLCTPECQGKVCGDDGCGGSCGKCDAFHTCQGGACDFSGGCHPVAVPGCGDCSCQACTCALDPYCCTGKWDALCVARCQDQCGGCGVPVVCGDGACVGSETCDSCPSDCGDCPPGCGAISSVGCCAEATLLRCQSGELEITNCLTGDFESCGWLVDSNSYGCGGKGSDPTGVYPSVCPAPPLQDVQAEVVLPAVCSGLGFVGCCGGDELYWCDVGGLHQLDCAGNPAPYDQCGWNPTAAYYDCGGNGTDPSGEASGVCPQFQVDGGGGDLLVPECKVGTFVASECGDVPWEGCCDAAGALLFCEAGKLLCKLDCTGLVYPANTCGWHAGQPGYYDCGGDGTDPLGEFVYQCPIVEGMPDVIEAELHVKTCDGVPDGGCCQGSALHWCEVGHERVFDCAQLIGDPVFKDYVYCGTNPVTGEADCLKKPDPSPPQCGVVVEPPIEPVSDIVWDILDIALEQVSPTDGAIEDGLGLELPAELKSGDGSGIVIPVEPVVEPDTKPTKDGCGAHPAPAPGALWLALLLVIALAGLHRPRQNVR